MADNTRLVDICHWADSDLGPEAPTEGIHRMSEAEIIALADKYFVLLMPPARVSKEPRCIILDDDKFGLPPRGIRK